MRPFAVVCNINMAEYNVRELTEQDFLQETEVFVELLRLARFENFSEHDLDGIESLKDEKATTKQTTWGVKLFRGESTTEVKFCLQTNGYVVLTFLTFLVRLYPYYYANWFL